MTGCIKFSTLQSCCRLIADTGMELSIIIVNWNTVELLRSCLASIQANPPSCGFETLVVDNASYDGSAELVSARFPWVTFIQSDQNLGFAAGNNLAFDRSLGRLVLFLNPDTEIVGDALNRMLDVLQTLDDAGVVGPKLVNPDFSVQLDNMRAFPTIFNEIFDSSLTRRLFGPFNFAGIRPVLQASHQPVSVEMLPGTCVLLRREVFERAGRFNERYFMYAEDVELSFRAKAEGLTNYYVASAAVIHHGGRSSEQKSESFFSTVMIREAVWQFFRATHGSWYASIYRATTFLAAMGRLSVLGLLRWLPVRRQIRSDAAYSTRKWTRVLRWTLGQEAWASGYRPAPAQNKSALAS
jgi:GT2 family glycosyltransferase